MHEPRDYQTKWHKSDRERQLGFKNMCPFLVLLPVGSCGHLIAIGRIQPFYYA